MIQYHNFPPYYHLIVTSGCPFCENAVTLLGEKGALIHIDDATDRGEWLAEQKEVYGWETVPIINKVQLQSDGSIDVEFIGGYTDLREHMNVGTENTTEATEEDQEESSDNT